MPLRRLSTLALLLALTGAARADVLPDAVGGDFLRDTLKAEACETDYADAKDSAMIFEVSQTHRLVDIPCRYESERNPNHRSLMFLVDLRGGAPARVSLPLPAGHSADEPAFVTNAEVDERRKLVLSVVWRKATRDCGTVGRWHFNGIAFELRDFFAKPACDGEAFDLSNRAIEKWRVFPARNQGQKRR